MRWLEAPTKVMNSSLKVGQDPQKAETGQLFSQRSTIHVQ